MKLKVPNYMYNLYILTLSFYEVTLIKTKISWSTISLLRIDKVNFKKQARNRSSPSCYNFSSDIILRWRQQKKLARRDNFLQAHFFLHFRMISSLLKIHKKVGWQSLYFSRICVCVCNISKASKSPSLSLILKTSFLIGLKTFLGSNCQTGSFYHLSLMILFNLFGTLYIRKKVRFWKNKKRVWHNLFVKKTEMNCHLKTATLTQWQMSN